VLVEGSLELIMARLTGWAGAGLSWAWVPQKRRRAGWLYSNLWPTRAVL